MIRKEGIGSYFHLENIQETLTNTIDLSIDYTIFYTGRHALLHILNEISQKKTINKLWFPNYYCQHTLGWIKKTYQNISIYEINPFVFSDETINIYDFAGEDDVVLINNYWGLSSMPTNNNLNSAIIIEDHSHGWLSNACLNSNADYCFVSLRKSLPIPLGGIFWQPETKTSNKNLNYNIDTYYYEVWDMMLKAMKLKTDYIQGDKNIDSSIYLPYFYKVEDALNKNTNFAKLLPKHKEFINSYISFNVKKIKEEHLNFLYEKIQDTNFFKVIKKPGYTAFGLHLLFKNENDMNSLKNFLITNSIYPSTLWPDNTVNYKWHYFLNIHIDFRYNLNDIHHIALTIQNWLNEKL
ncbi:hypothetical protein VP395_10340 [Mariniflexile soesokkakense]|uniref:dTDP-4-amino-4,6-dideoxygalactose transaminase n=1 Tax=Mariniflexile soesokkakense TaxID=1343160 RepID=A0ABV0AAJ2_9FLAO